MTHDATGRSRVVAIVNPATRRHAAAMVDLLRRETPPNVDLDVQLTTTSTPIVAMIENKLDGVAAVIAVGGDGTVAQVANALHGSDVPLAILPAGSTNIIAREMRIPMQPAAAIALLYGKHRTRLIDMGMCGDHAFLHIGGTGFDSMLFMKTNPRWKRRLGWVAYLPAAVRSFMMRPSHYSLTIDDMRITVDSALVLVTNGGGLIKASLRLYPDIVSDDGKLDVLVFTATTKFQILRTLFRLARGDLIHSPFVFRIQGEKIDIAAEPPMPVQVDGDVIGDTPATFTLIPKAIRLIVPAE